MSLSPDVELEVVGTFQYGTAGFRTKADVLAPVMYRVGILAALRSKSHKGAAIGVMITASHNPEPDNGVKIVEPMGEMLSQAWEAWATKLANCKNADLDGMVAAIVADLGIDMQTEARVVIGRDTRPSSPALAQACIKGIEAMSGKTEDFGTLTTPQLHHITRCLNDATYGEPTEAGYYSKMATAFTALYKSSGATAPVRLNVDCANGVGAPKFSKMLESLAQMVEAKIYNDGSGTLNEGCGADYVKVNQKAAQGMSFSDGEQCASFDGDADRLMFFFTEKGAFRMLDGDRIAGLCAVFLNELIAAAGLKLNLGIVQTAYANGGSTNYLKGLGIPIACAKTGVKHLHHLALDYDVGVYFEANGHGTVLFSDSALSQINACVAANDAQTTALSNLKAVVDLINQTVGDAISDLLLVQVILLHKNMSMGDWYAMYSDLPNRLCKVKIQDRSVVTTTNAERTCTAPAGLQDAINEIVGAVENGRSFVRPSGTEDVVRVYAEASTQMAADCLADDVCAKVHTLAHGVEALTPLVADR